MGPRTDVATVTTAGRQSLPRESNSGRYIYNVNISSSLRTNAMSMWWGEEKN